MLDTTTHSFSMSNGLPTSGAASPRAEGRLLIVESDTDLRRALHTRLFGLGFDISEASSADEALALCRILRYDGVLLSVDLPGRGGLETCKALRRLVPGIVIILLGIHEDEERKVEALEGGADDYVTRPFPMRELVARIRAALRRSRALSEQTHGSIAIGSVEIHPARRLVTKGGAPVRLTPKEFDLLHYLMAHAGAPVTHAHLLRVIWGYEHANQVEYLRTFMRQLRKKIEDDPSHPRYLLTESHIGYCFVEPSRAQKEAPALKETPGQMLPYGVKKPLLAEE
jgi:two-component system, OmpR family, KDP operon response regulator KdpE